MKSGRGVTLGADKNTAWTFITNHATVMLQIAKNPRITAREIAEETGISERAIRKIIADLARDKYIQKTKNGRRLIYSVNRHALLRSNSGSNVQIGDFLETFGIPSGPGGAGLAKSPGNSLLHLLINRYHDLKKIRVLANIYAQLFSW